MATAVQRHYSMTTLIEDAAVIVGDCRDNFGSYNEKMAVCQRRRQQQRLKYVTERPRPVRSTMSQL